MLYVFHISRREVLVGGHRFFKVVILGYVVPKFQALWEFCGNYLMSKIVRAASALAHIGCDGALPIKAD